MSDWGKGATNNDIGWGQGANNEIGWGAIHALSYSGDTDIVGAAAVDDRFIFTVKTDNAGTSGTNQFTIPTSTTGITQAFNYDIETSDGQTITGVTGNHTITFPSAGTYEVRISGSFPYMRFANGGDRLKMLDISNFGIYALGATSQSNAFQGCSNMTITATDSGNFGSVTKFQAAWLNCSSLTSFPLIDTSSSTDFVNSWFNCSSLTSFPLIDTSSGTNFNNAWLLCSSLTSFPLINTSSGTTFFQTWSSCSSLANYPANAFDTNIATNYTNAFNNTNLTTQSIDDILVSLDTSGVINGTFNQSGGQAPSVVGETAIDNLVSKGWTIVVTGGYEPTQLLLDEYPNAAAAYSLRELSTAFVGQPVVRVRRSSDNTEQDFTSVQVTDGTLETFVGAGNNGFVTTWYDQSGNGQDAVQATATIQPQLVDSGTVYLVNNFPVIKNPVKNIGKNLNINLSPLQPLPVTCIFAGKIDELPSNVFNGASGYLGGNVSTGIGGRYEFFADNNSFQVQRRNTSGTNSIITQAFNTNPFIQQGIFRESQLEGRQNGVDATPVNYTGTPFDSGTQIKIISSPGELNSSLAPAISVYEYVLYFSDQYDNRTGIETNINNHYNIYS